MAIQQRITPCLWFDGKAEDAARFYTSIFPNSSIGKISHYGKEGQETHHQKEGTVLTIMFTLDGQEIMGLNGGADFKFNEAVSLMVNCETQAEIDHYWERLGAGGDPNAQICGWLKDKFGLSWQIVPAVIAKLITDPDQAKVDRVMAVVMRSKKLNIAELEAAAAGKKAA
jgi:predicted 3-demethylubiquinone-9 3-methyltransferase (glyoxalase superfamily)